VSSENVVKISIPFLLEDIPRGEPVTRVILSIWASGDQLSQLILHFVCFLGSFSPCLQFLCCPFCSSYALFTLVVKNFHDAQLVG